MLLSSVNLRSKCVSFHKMCIQDYKRDTESEIQDKMCIQDYKRDTESEIRWDSRSNGDTKEVRMSSLQSVKQCESKTRVQGNTLKGQDMEDSLKVQKKSLRVGTGCFYDNLKEYIRIFYVLLLAVKWK
jgi:hypothetical protein